MQNRKKKNVFIWLFGTIMVNNADHGLEITGIEKGAERQKQKEQQQPSTNQ